MSDLCGKPEDWFSRVAAKYMYNVLKIFEILAIIHFELDLLA